MVIRTQWTRIHGAVNAAALRKYSLSLSDRNYFVFSVNRNYMRFQMIVVID